MIRVILCLKEEEIPCIIFFIIILVYGSLTSVYRHENFHAKLIKMQYNLIFFLY
jgi:hypothetical protein